MSALCASWRHRAYALLGIAAMLTLLKSPHWTARRLLTDDRASATSSALLPSTHDAIALAVPLLVHRLPPLPSMVTDRTDMERCPPHRSGSACTRPIFDACATQWGFDSPLAPCFVSKGVPVLPASCECLGQCERHTAAARIDCLHGASSLHVGSGISSTNIDLRVYTPPWKGNPQNVSRWWPELRVQYDPELVEALSGAAYGSRAAGLCGGRGVHASLVGGNAALRAVLGLPAATSTGKVRGEMLCSCVPGHAGERCAPLAWLPTNCVHGCSGRGTCAAGTCICAGDATGIDCSDERIALPHSKDAGTRTAGEREMAVLGLPPAEPHGGVGHQSNGPRGAEHAGADAGGAVRLGGAVGGQGTSGVVPAPRLYIYELPARLTTWLALPHLRQSTCGEGDGVSCWWQRTDPMYSADVTLVRRLLRSAHRTHDPHNADYFVLPLMLSLGFMTHRFGIYLPSSTSAQLVTEAVRHVQHAFPFWNRTDGADHLLTFTGDDGATWLRGRLPHLRHAIFLTHWGHLCNDKRLRTQAAGGGRSGSERCMQQVGFRPHRAGHDIVMPPLHSPHELLPASRWLGRGLLAPGTQSIAASSLDDRSMNSSVVRALEAQARGHARAARAAWIATDGARLRSPVSGGTGSAAEGGGARWRYLLYFVGKVNRSAREGDIYSGGVCTAAIPARVSAHAARARRAWCLARRAPVHARTRCSPHLPPTCPWRARPAAQVRQRVFAAHAHRTDFYLRHKSGLAARGVAGDADARAQSKFCLAPYGTGFGMREYDALLHGCVPLLIRVEWEVCAGRWPHALPPRFATTPPPRPAYLPLRRPCPVPRRPQPSWLRLASGPLPVAPLASSWPCEPWPRLCLTLVLSSPRLGTASQLRRPCKPTAAS